MKLLNRAPPSPEELDAEQQAQTAYREAKAQRRIENARQAGIRDADRLANKKPFHMKLLEVGKAVLRDMSTNEPNNFNFEYRDPFEQPQPKKKRKKRN